MMLRASEKNSAGYTMVELMVIIVLIGIAMAAVIPNFASSINTTRTERATAELQSDVRWAISNARANGRALMLVFTGNGYSIRDSADSTLVVRSRDYGNHTQFNASVDPMIFPWGMVQPTVVEVDGATGVRQLNLLPTGKLQYQNQEAQP
jgi:type II secretory pathway pseudopilin PulG